MTEIPEIALLFIVLRSRLSGPRRLVEMKISSLSGIRGACTFYRRPFTRGSEIMSSCNSEVRVL